MRITMCLFAATLVGCGGAADTNTPNLGSDARPAVRTFFISVLVPRIENSAKSFANVERVLGVLPCFAKATFDQQTKTWINANTNRIVEGTMNVQFHFAPTPASDLGDVSKALATLGGDTTQPVALVNLALATPIEEEKFVALKGALSAAKGIDWDHSDRLAIALDEAGGAKLEEIRIAYKKVGITLSDAFIDK